MTNNKIKVLISGANGRMGSATVKAVSEQADMAIVALVDLADNLDPHFKHWIGTESENIVIEKDIKKAIQATKPDVVVDFTNPEVVYQNTKIILENKVRPVIGTTGLTVSQLEELKTFAASKEIGGLIAPNFAIGAVLMMQFAKTASKYFDHAEIVELHHNKKLDAPSGTAIKTADLMEEMQESYGKTNVKDKELLTGARGAVTSKNIHIHSVRLPGLVAHQEVYLAGPGQLLTIRHDSFDRVSFMPGVILAIRNVMSQKTLIYGLENIL